jgi:hypothetical protein
MASYTSTQSGNFSNNATWGGGGYPSADADTFTIASGHTVTYDISTPLTTGFGDSVINSGGRLQFNSNTQIRMNGNLTINGDFIAGAGFTFFGRGISGDSHRLLFNQNGTNRLELVGSEGMQITTVNQAVTSAQYQQGFVVAASSSGFAIGDWISVHERGISDALADRNDEGFIIHDISGNNIYIREFVGPNTTINGADGNQIAVANAKIFRTWQKLIFGTGANRNIHNISSIDYDKNLITLSGSVTGSVVGETVYTTGPLQTKLIGDKIRKCATTVTVEASSSATQITVGSAAGFNIGDEIVVDARWPGTDNSYTDERPEKATITNISGNVITIDSSFNYLIYTGSFVVRLTRDCRFVTDTGQHYGFTVGGFTANWNTRILIRDVEFNLFSNSSDTLSRLYFAGRSRDDTQTQGIEIEGITYHRLNGQVYRQTSVYFDRYCNNWTFRCSVLWNTVNGIHQNNIDNKNLAVFNNYVARQESWGLIPANMGYSQTDGGAHEWAYNYVHRSDDGGILLTGHRDPGRGIHHNWVNVTQSRGLNVSPSYTQAIIYQNRFEGCFNPVNAESMNEHNLIYNEFIPAGNPFDFTYDSNYQRHNQSVTFTNSVVSLEHNYEYDAVTIYIPNGKRVWDPTEEAWFCTFDDDSGTTDSGLAGVYYIPANVTLRAKATIKLVPGFNGTAPKLEIRGCMDRFYVGANGAYAGEQPFRGFASSVDFNAANTTSYQSQQLVFDPKPWGRSVTVGVVNKSSNASEGWWEKPAEIKYDSIPPNYIVTTGINNFSSIISSGTEFGTRKIRIGGRII